MGTVFYYTNVSRWRPYVVVIVDGIELRILFFSTLTEKLLNSSVAVLAVLGGGKGDRKPG